MAIVLNQEAVAHAKQLIAQGLEVNHDRGHWEAVQPTKDEMARLLRERKEIDDRLSKLAPLVEYLSVLCDVPPAQPPMPSALDLA